MDMQRIDAIDALLPQTQCTRCGYPDCRAYAAAIHEERASYDQCPPGGQTGVRRIAKLLGRPEIPLNPEYGSESSRTAAVIDENRCIGCTLCIQACPVDAIMGSAKRMHTVLTIYCTGCDLCLAPCPVDCIDMIELDALASGGSDTAAQLLGLSTDDVAPYARRRYEAHQERIGREGHERPQRQDEQSGAKANKRAQPSLPHSSDRKKEIISAALVRARARRAEADRERRKRR